MRYSKLIAGFAILFFTSTSYSQNLESVHVTCLLEYDTIASDRYIPTDEFGCFLEFIGPLETQLAEDGIPLVTSNILDDTSDLVVTAVMATNNQLLYHLMPTNAQSLESSDILHRHLKSSSSFYTTLGFYFFIGDYVFSVDQELIDTALGLIHYERNQCDHASEYFNSALDLVGENAEFMTMALYFYLGNCSILQSDLVDAIEQFESGLNLTDVIWNSLELPTNLAWSYLQVGDAESAYQLLDDVWTQISESDFSRPDTTWEFLMLRADIKALNFDYTSAIKDMDSVIELMGSDDQIAQAYKQRGDIIMLIYEWNRALDDYNMAIELAPFYAEAYYRRGILYYTMVERENALADFETYLELDPAGQFVPFAEDYIANIQAELDALGG